MTPLAYMTHLMGYRLDCPRQGHTFNPPRLKYRLGYSRGGCRKSYLDELDGQGALPHSSTPDHHQFESFLFSAHGFPTGICPDQKSSKARVKVPQRTRQLRAKSKTRSKVKPSRNPPCSVTVRRR